MTQTVYPTCIEPSTATSTYQTSSVIHWTKTSSFNSSRINSSIAVPSISGGQARAKDQVANGTSSWMSVIFVLRILTVITVYSRRAPRGQLHCAGDSAVHHIRG